MIVCNSDTREDHNHQQMAYQSPSSTFLFQSHQDHHHHHHHQQQHNQSDHFASLLPQHFHGHPAFLMKRSMSFDQKSCEHEGVNGGVGDDELSDDGSQLGEKKKRLNLEQVKTLEKSFELGNKLEPERKLQLAKALGLQPRQVAIWFQNRRARWKTKQLERDYEVLKKQFNSLKQDNDTLQSQNKNLLAELLQLKTRDSNERGGMGLKKETDQGSWSNGSDNSSDLNLDISTTQVMSSPVSSQLSTKHLFNTSIIRPTGMTQFLNGSTMKMDQAVQDDNLCNMFGTIEDQPGMWTWPEPHHFH